MRTLIFALVCGLLAASGCGELAATPADPECDNVPRTVNRCAGTDAVVTCEIHDGSQAYCTVKIQATEADPVRIALCVPSCPEGN